MWIRVQGVDKGTGCGYGYRVWIRVQGVDKGTGCG